MVLKKVFYFSLALLTALFTGLLPSVSAAVPSPVPLNGNGPVGLNLGAMVLTGQAAASQPVTLVIGLKLSNPDAVRTAVTAIRTGQASPMTAGQFADLYAPSADDYAAVVSFLQANGFQVQTSPNRLIVTATGTVAQAENAFGVQINSYTQNGRTYYANAAAPLIPSSLSGIIQSVAGLDDLPVFHTLSRPVTPAGQKGVSGSVYTDYYGSKGFTPLGIQTAYGVTPVYNEVYGTGQAIDIVIWDSLQQSDVDAFDTEYNLPAAAIHQYPVGAATAPLEFNAGSTEATLDAEWSHAMAPGATINVYEAAANDTSLLEQAINEAIVQHGTTGANVLSMSWAAPEDPQNVSAAEIDTMDALFAQGAAEGMTLLAASGDNGAYGDDKSTTPCVEFPASDPYITGVGGTTLHINSEGSYAGETAWNAVEGLGYPGSGATPPDYQGSGGGFSQAFPIPSWQAYSSVLNYTYEGVNYNPQRDALRGVPDLALNAGAGTDVYVSGSDACFIGTSLAAPSWAGLTALVDQGLAGKGKQPLGYFNPTLYGIGTGSSYTSVFNQVYVGDNDTLLGTGPYYAIYGWNPVTGWGTPKFSSLYNYLVSGNTVFAPGITAGPATLPPDYPGGTRITVTGTNTHFDSSTTVSLYVGQTNYANDVVVESPTRLTFNLLAGLPHDYEFSLWVYDATDQYLSASLTVGGESAAICPSTLPVGYQPTAIGITGDNTGWTSGSTTVQVVYAASQEPALYLTPPEPATAATVYSGTSAAFILPAGLGVGHYDVVVNDAANGISLSAPLSIGTQVTLSAGTPVQITQGGSGTAVLNLAENVAGALSSWPPGNVVIDLPAGYTWGAAPQMTFSGGWAGNALAATVTTSPAGDSRLTVAAVQASTTSPGNAVLSDSITASASAPAGDITAAISGTCVDAVPASLVLGTGVSSGTNNPGGGGTSPASPVPQTPQPAPSSGPGTATASIGSGGGSVATSDGSVSVNIPANAFASTVLVTISAVPAVQALSAPTGFTAAGREWSISAGGAEPSLPVTVTFHYDPGVLGGLSPSRLGVYRYDPVSASWSWVGGVVDQADDTITVTLPHFSIYSVMVNKTNFSDLAAVPWAKDDIDTLLGADVIEGTGPKTFDPGGTVTRAQFAAFLVRARGLRPDYTRSTPFTDVPASAWYAPYVASAYRAGLVAGITTDTFAPNAPISREQMAAMLSRLIGGSASGTSLARFTDAKSIAAWAVPGVRMVVAAGLVAGFPDGTFRPGALSTRAQAAVTIARYLRYTGKV